MKIVLIGGHLAPALSVLEALPESAEVLFIGRKYALEGDDALSLEYRTITSLKVSFVALNTGRLQRKITKYTIFSLLKLPSGIIKSFLLLRDFKPDIVIGFGSYVSIPVTLCAYVLRIPVVIHEQTMEAGLANRLLSRLATKICISWNSSRKYFPRNKVVLTGNPMRKFALLNSELLLFNNKLPTIYITGGSSGSHYINELIEGILKELLESYNIIHQVGEAKGCQDYHRLHLQKKSLPESLRERYILQKSINPSQVGDLLKAVSFVISRSGVNIITELIHFEKPAILIPLPFSQKNEQLKNAKFLKEIGLAVVLPQSELTGNKLLRTIKKVSSKMKSFRVNKQKYKELQGKSAAQHIVSVISDVYKSKKKKAL